MAPATVLARRLLHRIGRLADGMDELPLVLAISIGGFYVSILAMLALASPPTAETRATVPQYGIHGSVDAPRVWAGA
jgi:hypothetical protein